MVVATYQTQFKLDLYLSNPKHPHNLRIKYSIALSVGKI